LNEGLDPCLSRMRGQLACPVLRGARTSNGPRLLDIHELRNAPLELKLRELRTLMMSADLFENATQREAEARKSESAGRASKRLAQLLWLRDVAFGCA